MRIIAGTHKGRALKAVPGKDTRPTTDKVKEAVFQMMGPFFDGGSCLDLFAGSGSLGIEALSRGMDRAVFVDRQNKAIHTIQENLEMLKISNLSEVYRTDANRAIQILSKKNMTFTLILLDPPYKKADYEKLIRSIIKSSLLKDGGMLYCEHDAADQMPLLNKELQIIKQANYGTIGITMYRKGENEHDKIGSLPRKL
ncbi:16S rRNA (guanine(966)-N(2))-methyltransferase RsmD [Virgibacillus halophilus]